MKKGSASRKTVTSTLVLCFTFYALNVGVVRADATERFRLVRDYLIVVPVMLNGEGPFEFLLDTGANTTLIDLGLAAELGVRPVERVALVTAAGSQFVPRAQLRSLTLGRETLTGLEVLSADLRSLHLVDARIRGVVGWSVLSKFNFLIDYGRRRVELGDGGGLAQRLVGTPHPLEEDDGKPVVWARFPARGEKPLRLVVDSGIERLALFGAAARRVGGAARSEGQWVEISTLAGSQSVRAQMVRALQVGDETFRHLPALVMPDEGAVGVRTEDGLLPARLFRSVYFDREGFVIFNPRLRN